MSFYINNIELAEAYFNGSEVSSIYYNGTKVWEAGYPWVGWASATWADIYALCKAKQTGECKEWPADVVLGAEKTITLSTSVLGSSSVKMILIGIDIDGSGILTFQSKNALPTADCYSVSGTANEPKWTANCNVRNYCQNFYNYCNAKAYIKTLTKLTAETYGSSTLTSSSDSVWVPSAKEIGLTGGGYAEYTSGVSKAYPYYSSDASRIKYKGDSSSTAVQWHTRSRKHSNKLYTYMVSTAGAETSNYNGSSNYVAPAFAIG